MKNKVYILNWNVNGSRLMTVVELISWSFELRTAHEKRVGKSSKNIPSQVHASKSSRFQFRDSSQVGRSDGIMYARGGMGAK